MTRERQTILDEDNRPVWIVLRIGRNVATVDAQTHRVEYRERAEDTRQAKRWFAAECRVCQRGANGDRTACV